MKKNKGILMGVIFILVILGALAVAEWYQLRYIARIREGAYVINSPEIAKNLTRGIEPEDPTFALLGVEKGEDIYQRGNTLYVGLDRKKIEDAYPFFTNDGNAVMIVRDSSVLIDDSFEEATTYQGMYVSAGLSFNYDKVQADDADYLFLKLENGLYMNAQPIRFDYPGGDSSVRMNSVFYFGKDAVRYYAVRKGDSLEYGEVPTVNMLTVTIGGKTYSYEQFLNLLGITDDKPAWKKKAVKKEETAAVPLPRPLKETEETPAFLPEEFERLEETQEEEKEESVEEENTDTEREKAERELKNQKEKKKKEQKKKQNTTASKNTGGQTPSKDTSSPTTERPADPDGEIPAISGNDVSGSDVSGNDAMFRPFAELGDFTEDIYSVYSTLKISDPSYTLKRVEVELFWRADPTDANIGDKDAYQLMYRKSFRTPGEITIDNLPPDTRMYARGVVVYSVEGETKRYEFFNGLEDHFDKPIQTKPLSEMDDIYVDFTDDPVAGEGEEPVKVPANQMQVFSFRISGPNPNVLQRVQSIQIEVTPTDEAHKGNGPYLLEMIESAGLFQRNYFYQEEGGTWISDDTKVYLPSSMEFDYSIALYDRFGNAIKRVVRGYYADPRLAKEDDSEEGEQPEDPETEDAGDKDPVAAIDWNSDKSLSHTGEEFKKYAYGAAEYDDDELTGHSHTSRMAPSVTIAQKRFEDNQPNRDRAKFEIGIRDADGTILSEYKGNYYLTILRKNADDVFVPFEFKSYAADGVTPVTEAKQITEGGETKEYTIVKIADANFPSGSAADTENSTAACIYDILGLTAGCVYEIRVYGNYDLADGVCAETVTPQIWSQQFSTADLSTYGNVAYNITNKHIKTEIWPDGKTYPSEENPAVNELSPYESATAQEISIELNSIQTSEVLKELMTDMQVKMTEKAESGKETTTVLSAAFDVQKMKEVMAVNTPERMWQPADASENTGRFPLIWDEICADRLAEDTVFTEGKVPALYLEATMPLSGEQPNVWEMFASGAKLVIRFEDGTLSSNTDYQVNMQTWAFQGDTYHDVSSRGAVYKSREFRTLKKMPYVTVDYRNVLMVSDYIEIPEIRFHDDDNAIVGGVLSADRTVLQGAVQASLETIEGFGNVKDTSYLDVDYDYGEGDEKDYGGVCRMLEYHGLINGDTYRISLTPSAIIRDTKSGDYTIRREAVYTYEFVMGSGLDGDIIFDSITFPMEGEDENGKALLKSNYSLYDATDFTLGELQKDGTIADDSDTTMTNGSDVMAASPFIEVEPGGIYNIDDVCGSSSTGEIRVCFYANKDAGNATYSTVMDRKNWEIIDSVAGFNSSQLGYTYVLKASGDAGTSYSNVIRIPEGIHYIRFMMRGINKTTDIPAYVTANCFKLKSSDETAEDVLGAVECVMKSGTEEPYHVGDSEYVPVKAGETYAIVQGYHWYYYEFYNASKGKINPPTYAYRTQSGQATLGRTVNVPANAAYMRVFEDKNVNKNTAQYLTLPEKTLLYKVDKSKLNRLESKDPEHFYNAFRVRVEDKQNNLINSREVYLKVYNETDGRYVNLADQSGLNANDCIIDYETIDGVSYNVMELALNEDGNETLDFSEALDYLSGSHKEFTMGLYVRYNGKMIELDSQTMQTDRELLTIDSRKSMSRLARYPKADFLVVDDITMCTNDRVFNELSTTSTRTAPVPFEGTIDFQGHTLNTRSTGNYYCFNAFSHDALLENIVLNTTFDYNVVNSEIDYVGGLVGNTYGTIRNVVVNLSLGRENYARQNYSASICRNNYGLIENFSLNYDSSSTNYVGKYFGGVCRDNYGTIRNGYAYTEKPLALTRGKYGGDSTKDVKSSGLVCSVNRGTLENIYTVGDVAVELTSKSGTITTSALLTGCDGDATTDGAVRNCFSVGNLRKMYWEDSGDEAFPYTKKTDVYDASIPLAVPRVNTMVKNNYFYSREAANYKDYSRQVSKITDPVVFRDLSFYGRTVNQDNAFHLEDVGNGNFPRVEMRTDMMLKQPTMPLEKTEIDVSVRYLYAEDIQVHYTDDADYDKLEGGGYDYATATLVFQNEHQREIDYFEAESLLFMNPGDDMNVCLNRGSLVKLKSEYQQGDETSYKIKVKFAVNPQNPRYEGIYPVSRFTYGSYTVPVANQDISVPFYKLVTQDNWLTVFTDKISYYRLGTDIDFEKAPLNTQKENASKVLVSGTFTGTLDGRGKTVRNFQFGGLGTTKLPYMIETMQGTLKNIRFENLTIDGTGFTKSSDVYGLSLIRRSDQGAKIQGVVLKNVDMTNGQVYGGALVSRAYRTTIEDCVISNLKMHDWNPNTSGYTGGMVGSGETNTRISNCLVRNIQMDLPFLRGASGVGALSGYISADCTIDNCYTQGYIRSRGLNIGGLVGSNAGRISSCWTKVDIFTERNPIGGLVGTGSCNISRVLSVGDLYIANNTGTNGTDGINRIGGSGGARSRCYAAKEQAVNGVKSTNLYGAAELLSIESLKQETTYWETINLGASFDCSVVKEGYLPLLKYKDGHALLPEQDIDRTLQPTEWAPFTAEGSAEVMEPADWKADGEQNEENKTADYDLTVSIDVTVENLKASDFVVNSDGSVSSFISERAKSYFGEYFENFTIEGLRFAENDGHRTMPKITFGEGGKITLTFEHVRAERYADDYRVEWRTPANTQTADLKFKTAGTETETNLYRYIYRAKQNESVADQFAETDAENRHCDPNSWEGAMELGGDNDENFMIMADLDFSFIQTENKELKRDLMINRLEGGRKYTPSAKEYERKDYLMADNLEAEGDYYEIANLTYTTTGSGNDGGWIYRIRRGMSYLHFKNISWTQACTSNFSRAALIRYQRAPISYIDISDFTLTYGTAGSYATGYAGFIGDSNSTLTYVRGRDIRIQTPNAAAARNTTYVGGIAAYSTSSFSHIGIKGTKTVAEDGSETWSYEVVGSNTRRASGSSTTNTSNSTYTGGISGRCGSIEYSYADGIHVTGNSYTGGLYGIATAGGLAKTDTTVDGLQRPEITMRQTAEEEDVDEKIYLAEVKNSKIKGGYRAGGLFGQISGSSGAQFCRSKDNEITSYERAGGIGGYIVNGAQYSMVSGCKISTEASRAGGISGDDGANSFYRSIVRNSTIAAGTSFAGGIAANSTPRNTTSYTTGTVYNCAIYANKWVGGIYGLTAGGQLYGALVKDCWIGSKINEHPEVVKTENGDGKVVWEKRWITDERNGSMMVGGITGGSFGARLLHCVVEDDAEIYGRKYVGGVLGTGGGGSGKNSDTTSRYIETGAKVHVTEKYGGGYAGLLVTYERDSTTNANEVSLPVTRLMDVIVAGEVDGGTSAEWVGGFVGAYTYKRSPKTAEDIRHPETGAIIQVVDKTTGYKAYISQNNFKRIVLAVTSVTGKAGCTGLLSGYGDGGVMYGTDADADYKDSSDGSDIPDRRAFVQDRQCDATEIEIWDEKGTLTSVDYRGISGLRIFGGTTINGQVAANDRLVNICTAKATTAGTADTLTPLQKSWHYTEGTAMADYVDAMYVTTNDLKSIDFYYAPEANGGLNLRGLSGSPVYYNADDTPNQFHNIYYEADKVNVETGAVFPRMARVNTNAPGWILGAWVINEPTIHDGIPIPTRTFTSFAALNISYALDHVATYASDAGSINLELPEILVTEDDTQGGVMLLSAEGPETDAVMPAKASVKSSMKTKAAEMKVSTLAPEDGNAVETNAPASADEDVIEVVPESCFQIYDENGELLYQDIVGQRVYTIPYDFKSTLTVKVFAGDEARSYVVTGDSARHTVMTWEDHCYYLKADGVYRDKGPYQAETDSEKNYANTEKVLSGSFVHLYGGKALAEDGSIYDVVSGKPVNVPAEAELFVPAEEEKAAYETRYGKEELLTYRLYTATAEEKVVSDYRLFAHDGKLFGMDPALDQPYGENFQDFVADYYATSQGSAEYLSALTENGTLTDYRTPLNWPTDEKQQKILDNYGIREVGDNLRSDRSYVVIRYENNVVAAFDYLTGSLLFIDDTEKETLDFVTYVDIWVKGKKAAMHTANAYINAKGLLGELLEDPVDDEQLVGYVNGKNEVGADGNPEGILPDIAVDGTNVGSGENRTETGANSTGSSLETVASTGQSDADSSISEEMAAAGMYGAGETISAGTSGDAAGNGIGTGHGSVAADGSDAESGTGEAVGKADGEAGMEGSRESGEAYGKADGGAGAEGSRENGEALEKADGMTGAEGERRETSGSAAEGSSGREGGTGNSAESGTGRGDGTGAEGGTGRGDGTGAESGTGHEDGTGAGEASGYGSEAEEYPPLTSDLAYVTMLTAEGSGYEIFRASELLNRSGKILLSENQKLKMLEANGIRRNTVDLESMKLTEEENRTGILLVGAVAVAVLLLLGLLYYKKRKMSRMM